MAPRGIENNLKAHGLNIFSKPPSRCREMFEMLQEALIQFIIGSCLSPRSVEIA
jgi:hypothetical protein